MPFWASLPPCPRLYNAADRSCPFLKIWSTWDGDFFQNTQWTRLPKTRPSRRPSRGEINKKQTVIRIPFHTSEEMPTLTRAAPISPPISAWEELVGSPTYHVIRSHRQALIRVANIIWESKTEISIIPLPIVPAT